MEPSEEDGLDELGDLPKFKHGELVETRIRFGKKLKGVASWIQCEITSHNSDVTCNNVFTSLA